MVLSLLVAISSMSVEALVVLLIDDLVDITDDNVTPNSTNFEDFTFQPGWNPLSEPTAPSTPSPPPPSPPPSSPDAVVAPRDAPRAVRREHARRHGRRRVGERRPI